MKKDSYKTKVIFRTFSNGEVIGLFPEIIERGYFIMSYMMVGEHSPCDYKAVIKGTKLSKEDEYRDIKSVLESHYGYNLKVIKRCKVRWY